MIKNDTIFSTFVAYFAHMPITLRLDKNDTIIQLVNKQVKCRISKEGHANSLGAMKTPEVTVVDQ